MKESMGETAEQTRTHLSLHSLVQHRLRHHQRSEHLMCPPRIALLLRHINYQPPAPVPPRTLFEPSRPLALYPWRRPLARKNVTLTP